MRPKASPKDTVVAADVEGEMVLLDIDAGTYFGLDEIGSVIWRRLTEGASEDEIVSSLLDIYDVEPTRLHADVVAFLNLLQERGLTEVVEE